MTAPRSHDETAALPRSAPVLLTIGLLVTFGASSGLGADEGYIAETARKVCDEKRAGGIEEYRRWMDARLRALEGEVERARDSAVEVAYEWRRIMNTITKTERKIRFAKMGELLTDPERVSLLLAELLTEMNALRAELEDTTDRAKRKALQDRIDELRELTVGAEREVERAEMIGSEIKEILKKLKTQDDLLAESRQAKKDVERRFSRAWNAYQEARILMAAATKIDHLVMQCLSRVVLSAYWMSQGRNPAYPQLAPCSSGRLTIEFDDSGNGLGGTLTTDCLVYADATRTRVVECPPASAFPVGRVFDVRTDPATGRIDARVVIEGKRDGFGYISQTVVLFGTVRRSEDPMRYGGSGLLQVPDSGPGDSHVWQSDPPLRCQ